MPTIPPISTQEHITAFIERQREYFPHIHQAALLFFDSAKCLKSEEKPGYQIHVEDLMNYEQFALFFEKLCVDGRERINLSSDSLYGDFLLVSVEYSQSTGMHATLMASGGPVINSRLSVIKKKDQPTVE